MKILVDGDACPVKEIIYDISNKYNVPVVVIKSISHHSSTDKMNTVYVDNISQAADMAIINRADKGDIIVTGDYGLASLCLMKGCLCISFTGKNINSRNIDEFLNMRFLGQKIRLGGGRFKGPPKRNIEDDERFKENLEHIILRQQLVLSSNNEKREEDF